MLVALHLDGYIFHPSEECRNTLLAVELNDTYGSWIGESEYLMNLVIKAVGVNNLRYCFDDFLFVL